MGNAVAAEVVAGNVEVTGTIDRCWLDTKLLKLMGLAAPHAAPVISTFDIIVSITDGTQKLQVISASPETISFDVPQDGWITHSFDFIARDFTITA